MRKKNIDKKINDYCASVDRLLMEITARAGINEANVKENDREGI